MTHSILTQFTPPQDYIGDFGMLCGFTAERDTFEQIARNFSGDGSRPHIAAFIHPTASAVTDIPGVAWMHFRNSDTMPFGLLHAKVALLGFRHQKDPNAAYRLRLLVNTGNWTSAPLTTSIDMYWCGELAVGEHDDQLGADILAAADLLRWLRSLTNDSLLCQTFDGLRADELFLEMLDNLPKTTKRPRFFDTRGKSVKKHILERLGNTKKCARLVLGSGYFEAGGDSETGVLEKFRGELVHSKKLTSDARLDLVLNPESCQGIHLQAEELVKIGWVIRRPGSPYAEHGDAKLHAKFLFLCENDDAGPIGRARLYIGSGNFSKKGFESTIKSGNLEAGIIIRPDKKLSWRKNARNSIRALLPVKFDGEIKVENLVEGQSFEPPPPSGPPPPVTFLHWADGRLLVKESLPDYAESLMVIGPCGAPLCLPCDWPERAPAFVTLLPDRWQVPVFADGALVVPKRRNLTVEDILADIGRFPAPPDTGDLDEDVENSLVAEAINLGQDHPVSDITPGYPIRRMMRLIVALTEKQKSLGPRDWARWCRELKQTLEGLAETEKAMILPFVQTATNPLCALLDGEFCPKDVKDGSKLREAVEKVSCSWGLQHAKNLWR